MYWYDLWLHSKSAIEDVQAQNLICILDVDIQGVKNIKETDLNPIYISVQPPSMEILVRCCRWKSKTPDGEKIPNAVW